MQALARARAQVEACAVVREQEEKQRRKKATEAAEHADEDDSDESIDVSELIMLGQLDDEEEERWAAAATAAAATSGGGSSGASARAELPEDFICPITFEIMADPVITIADGETYERAAIEDWFARGNRTAPRSNEPLGDTTLVPNKTLKRAITTWREQHHE